MIVIGISAAGTFVISGYMTKPVVSLKEKITGLNLDNITKSLSVEKPLMETGNRSVSKEWLGMLACFQTVLRTHLIY